MTRVIKNPLPKNPEARAKRLAKSAAFFAKQARRADADGDRAEARRLAEVAQAKGAAYYAAKGAVEPVKVTYPRFHQRMMAALDGAQYAGGTLSPIHSAIRRALREANMGGKQFASPAELADAVGKFSPLRRELVMAAAEAA